MRIHDLKHFTESLLLYVTFDKSLQIAKNERVKFIQTSEKLILSKTAQTETTEVKVRDINDAEKLQHILNVGQSYIASVIDIDSQKNNYTVLLKTYERNQQMDLKISFEDDTIKQFKTQLSQNELLAEMKELYLIRESNKTTVLVALHKFQEEDDLSNFYLVGKDTYLKVGIGHTEEGEEYFKAIERQKINPEKFRFYLIEGDIDFVLNTEEAQVSRYMKGFLEEVRNDAQAYINIWDQYGKIEFNQMIDDTLTTGFLRYSNCEKISRMVYKLTFDKESNFEQFVKRINYKMDNLSISAFSPRDVFTNATGATEFVTKYNAFAYKAEISDFQITSKVDAQAHTIYVTSKKDVHLPQSNGFIFKSINGYLKMNKRREEAFRLIFDGKTGVQNLMALFDGKGMPRRIVHREYIEPLSDNVMKKAFPKNPPTPKQKEAIEIALNTPDVAIIQGPPGTGKTTVIVGIFERLNEIVEGEDRRKSKNLVTAFQHDAVQNVAERLKVLDLPTLKFGSKSSDVITPKRVIQMSVENWINEKVNRFYEMYPSYDINQKIASFDRIYHNYLQTANTLDESIRLLEELHTTLRFDLSVELDMKLSQIIHQLKRSAKVEEHGEENLLLWAKRLPDHPVKFTDNGEYNVKMMIRLLEREANPEYERYIQLFKQFLVQEDKPYSKMYSARKLLILMLQPQPKIFTQPKQRTDILSLFVEMKEYISDQILSLVSEDERILHDYLEEYELNPITIQQTILNYMTVLGATNQQSVSLDLQKQIFKKSNDNKSNEEMLTYDNVIIDEAARSNPLDLFIPMSRAKRRIILVGDHRQLPHIVDDGIVRLMESETTKNVSEESIKQMKEKLQQSLFETLFKKLHEQEEKDGIKRTVTLDRQYRTHPLLGDFVSKNFYEIHHESRVESGLDASYFTHQLPQLEDKAAVWLNVPASLGKEKSGKSKSRPIEAKKIVEHLKSVILSEEAKGCNFGIITFYAEQVKEIYEELVRQNMARKEGEGYEILSPYNEEIVKGSIIEKLRIGTVDAFQGMEFDFVYLSMVRSNDLPSKTEYDLGKKYGFITIENRLCVSMSRQKKMLIVAGDKEMLYKPNADKAILPLINFYEHCVKDERYGKEI